MKWPKKCSVLILIVAILAVMLRLPQLSQRPMHTDEAVHAVKFSQLLEKNLYKYNPNEYHGPTLNYLALIPALLSSAEKFTDVTEFTLRIVPVFFGVALVLLLLLLTDGLGRTAAICAALLTTVSPAFVFYSRYYIQEMLLVCFTFGVIVFGYRYTQGKSVWSALLAGVFLGLMHATKETCIIAVTSILLALLLVLLMKHQRESLISSIKSKVNFWHIGVVITVAAIVSALFYSSFLANPAGIPDSFRAYSNYFNRASQNLLHIHPWCYYLKMLIYSKYASSPAWSEAIIIFLAMIGLTAVITKKSVSAGNFQFLRFIAFYTIIMTVLYSVIPYKTPWSMLGFLHGMILLAGIGAAAVIKLAPDISTRVFVGLLFIVGCSHLAWQAYLASYRYYADTRNPYVYAHPVTDVFAIVQRIEDVAAAHPDGRDMYIQVICAGDDYWPFPWYLRGFGNVAWQNKVDDSVVSAPLIIASSDVELTLMKKLYELPAPGKRSLYVPLFDSYMHLRPQVELRGYVTKELLDNFHQRQELTTQRRKQLEGKK